MHTLTRSVHKPQIINDTIFKHCKHNLQCVVSLDTDSHFVLHKRTSSSMRTHDIALNVHYKNSLLNARATLYLLTRDGYPLIQSQYDRHHHVLSGMTSSAFNAEGNDHYTSILSFGFDVQEDTEGILMLVIHIGEQEIMCWHSNVLKICHTHVCITEESIGVSRLVFDKDQHNQYLQLLHRHNMLLESYRLLILSYNSLCHQYLHKDTIESNGQDPTRPASTSPTTPSPTRFRVDTNHFP